MRPELFPHSLDFSVSTWMVLLCVAAVGLGVYNGAMTYLREGKTAQARSQAVWQALLWGAGGVAAVRMWLIPNLIAPDAAIHGGYYHLPLHTYGFALALGFWLAISLSARDAARSGIFPGETPPRTEEQKAHARNAVLDLSFWVLISALVGARLYFIAVNWDTGPEPYNLHPENIFKFWTGGLVFYGGFLGAVGASIVYSMRNKLNFLKLADIAIPTVSLGQFFGRLGCFSSGCCYGKEIPSSLSAFGVRFPQVSLAWETMVNQRHQLAASALTTPPLYPSQLIDGTGQLLIFFFLTFFLKPRKRFDGQILLAWLVLYPLLRFSDEFVRGDTERGLYTSLHVSAGQITSLLLMCGALGLLIWTHRRRAVETAVAA